MPFHLGETTIWQIITGVLAAFLGFLGIRKIRISVNEKESSQPMPRSDTEHDEITKELREDLRSDIRRIETKVEAGLAEIRAQILALTREVGALQGTILHHDQHEGKKTHE